LDINRKNKRCCIPKSDRNCWLKKRNLFFNLDEGITGMIPNLESGSSEKLHIENQGDMPKVMSHAEISQEERGEKIFKTKWIDEVAQIVCGVLNNRGSLPH
jgi:hypothetical protein